MRAPVPYMSLICPYMSLICPYSALSTLMRAPVPVVPRRIEHILGTHIRNTLETQQTHSMDTLTHIRAAVPDVLRHINNAY